MTLLDTLVIHHREREATARAYQTQRNLTDLGNAARFIDAWHDKVRFDHIRSKWFIWDGRRWMQDERHLISHLGQLTVRSIYAEAEGLDDERDRKKTADWAKSSESAAKIRALLDLAKGDPQVACATTDFDNHPHLLNTPAGVYDLQTAQLRPHDPDLMLTKITAISPDPEGESHEFTTFLKNVTLDRPDLIDALHRFLGSGLSGHSPKERIAVWHGSGANGKSALAETIRRLLGDYAGAADISTIERRQRSGGHSDDLAALAGIRFVVTSESNDQVALDEARVKAMTGGDAVTVSRKFEQSFSYVPAFSIAILSNNLPRIGGLDDGIWRRIALFPFDWTVPENQRDNMFVNRLIEREGPYILAWLIAGATLWYKSGYGDLETVKRATESYRRDEDEIGVFLHEECELREGALTSTSDLKRAYEKWCDDNALKPIQGRAYGSSLKAHGLNQKRTAQTRWWVGVELLSGGGD